MKTRIVIKYLGLGLAVLAIPGGIPLVAAWLYWKHKERVENKKRPVKRAPPNNIKSFN